jgi:hypothetical protein
MNPAIANRPNASAEISSIAISGRTATQIHRDNRDRSEQHARIAPAQRCIPKYLNRYRHQLFRQPLMHRIEHRASYDRLKHLPCGRHIMHFIELEFLRRRHVGQKWELCNNKDSSDNNDAPGSRIVENGRRFSHEAHTSMTLQRSRVIRMEEGRIF